MDITTKHVANTVNVVVNGMFARKETKEAAQNTLFTMIKLACNQYQTDENFRSWIDFVGDPKNQTKPEKIREDK